MSSVTEIRVLKPPTITSSPDVPDDVLKQYGNTDDATSVDYPIISRDPRSGETLVITAEVCPEFMAFYQHTDEDDDNTYDDENVPEHEALLAGAPMDDTDIGTHSFEFKVTGTFGTVTSSDSQTFNLTFANHPHAPL